jgi:ATP-binding cassette subfamily B protein
MMISSTLLNTLLVTLMILVFDWRIGAVLIVGLMIFFVINDVILKASMKLAPKKDVSDAVLVEQILEYLQGITEVKSYRLTGKQCKNLNEANDKNVAINLAMEKKYVPLIGIQTLVIKLIGIAMSVASIGFYLQGSMSLLICIVMIVASFIVYGSLESASGYTALLRSVDIAVEKANAILKTPQMDVDGADLQPKTYEIRAENISFSYDSKKIIDNVSFTIPEKSTLAIVGPSGGGKTTLTSLISRFWDVDSGTVYLDGKNVKDYSYDSLMQNFSFVFQNVYLFQDTIANNIRFGTLEAGMDEVIAAAKKACCHEFIQKLPKGYDTVIGEDGVNLSGGERQRLSIARAIMKDAPIIILDEATANVDPENEADLMNAVEELTKEKTIIMIAHRLKTVRKADQILVIEKGRIAEQGTHDALLQKNGIYNRFICSRKEAVSWKVQKA